MDVLGPDVARDLHLRHKRGPLDQSLGHDGFFDVHMCVVTANIGKRLYVCSGCALEHSVSNLLSPLAIEVTPRVDLDTNTVKLHIKNWPELFSCLIRVKTAEFRALHDLKHADIRDVFPSFPEWEDAACLGTDVGGDTTVTVTSRGSVILRFSWEKTIVWTSDLQSRVMRASDALCELLAACC